MISKAKLIALFLPLMFTLSLFAQAALAKTCDVDGDADIDKNDISLITEAHGTPASGSDDPRDADGDGKITVLDSRKCVLQCSRATCAINTVPVANNDTYTTAKNTPLNVTAPGVLKNDTDTEGDSLTVTLVNPPASGNLTLNANGSFNFTPANNFSGNISFSYRANDNPANSNIATATIKVTQVVDPNLPPDPATVAPPLDRGVATNLAEATSFLYTGTNPIQTGVVPGTINPKRAAVLRGKILAPDNTPLSGVKITLLNHPELGQTISRADGMFDLAANGGGLLTINYQKTGYLPAQRQINVPWQDYVFAEDVVLIKQDSQVSKVDLADTTQPFQVAQGSPVTDADGTRQATLLIPKGTHAQVYNADGSTRSVSNLTLRLTEYTVGTNGPKSMPAALPPESAYTYAFEMKAEESDIKIGGKDVLFDRAVPFYIDNFLNFPVGMIVPVGYYDQDKAAWIPSDNGKVIKILGVNAKLALIDSNGDNTADDAVTLAALGITDEERAKLAELYAVGKTLWRVQVDHLSTWDCNWPYTFPPDAVKPTNPVPRPDPKLDDPCISRGSIIECENQLLRESIPIVGTGLTLNYASDRQRGRKAAYSMDIQLSGKEKLPQTLSRIDVEVKISGQQLKNHFPPTSNQKFTYIWNGKDGYGRDVVGQQQATVRIGYVYQPVYATPAAIQASFAKFSGVAIDGSRSRNETIVWQEFRVSLGVPDSLGLGTWTLAPHHFYDPIGKVLYQGDGQRRSAEGMVKDVIITAAGKGHGFSGDGGPATQANMSSPFKVAVAADGSVYIVDRSNHRIRKVDPNGIITTVAGTTMASFCGDGGPASQACLKNPDGVAVAADGSFYIADTSNSRIRKVSPNGMITTVAGSSVASFCGDGGPATQACLNGPSGIAVAADGSVYIADRGNNRIRKVDPNGIIATVAGNGMISFCGDNGPAMQACLGHPQQVTVAADGSLYIADYLNNRIRKVSPDGIITTVAGNGTIQSFCGDGGPAIQACLYNPYDIVVSADGNLYIADASNYRIRKVSPDGIINTIAGGNKKFSFCGDGGPATQACLASPTGVALSHDGSLYIADHNNDRIRRIDPPLPGFAIGDIALASEDGSLMYRFNLNGRHFETINTLTGAVIQQFGYDNKSRLISITDVHGNKVTIERDSQGNPKAIVAPFGQRTELSLNPKGYLTQIKSPANETHQMTYTDDGLLLSFTDSKGGTSAMTYDALGRLVKDQDAFGGSQSLTRTPLENGHEVARITGMNRKTTYRVENLSTGDLQRQIADPDGMVTTMLKKTDGTIQTTLADGTVTTLLQGPDPRFGMQSPLPKSLTTTTGGLTSNFTMARKAQLSDSNNPMSLTKLTNTMTLNGRTFTSEFDVASKTATATTAKGRKSAAILDTAGRVIQVQVPGISSASLSYDSHGRLATLSRGATTEERTATFSYNAKGYLDTLTDSLGRMASFAYDNAGRITRQILPDLREIQYAYDANGNLISLTPPGRPGHLFTYTAVDQTEKYQPPLVTGTDSTLYAYNADRQLTRITRPDKALLDFSYDNAGRLKALTLPNNLIYGYNYNATGKLSNITAPGGVALTYTFNGALLTESRWDGPVKGHVGRTYDNDFRVTSLNVNGTNPIAFQYDTDSLLIKAGDLTLTRSDQNGLLTGTTLGTLPNAVQDSYAYNGFGEIKIYEAKYGATSLLRFEYSYDKLGRITQKKEIRGASTRIFDYSYDTAGRLIEVKLNGATTASYGYDANGNRTHLNSTLVAHYDNQDRLLDYQGTTYQYTANGELKQKTASGQKTTYDYDALGNLRKVVLQNGTVIDYLTDGQNRRIAKKVNGALVQAFLYQGKLTPIAELDGNGNIKSRFVYATGINVPDYMIKGGVIYRIIKDHLGSPRLIIDVVNNMVAQELDYDSFGNVTKDTNPGFQPFGFAGGLYDQDTKLVRFGARDYDTETGRWTVKDPILFNDIGTNLYKYTKNNPLNYLDSNGLWAISITAGAALALFGGGEGAVGFAFDSNGNFGTIDSVGLIGGLYASVPTVPGLTLAWNWDAASIDDFGGLGIEVGVLAGPVAFGYSGSQNGKYDPQCQPSSSNQGFLHGGFFSFGGEGVGAGIYAGVTQTVVRPGFSLTASGIGEWLETGVRDIYGFTFR